MPFKTLFRLSRYDFRLPRYRRVKRRIIFHRLLSPSSSLIRISRSHLVSLTYLKLQTSDRRDSWKNVGCISRNVYRSLTAPTLRYVTRYGNFECLYLGNGLRYQDGSKSDLIGTISSTFPTGFDHKILNPFSDHLHKNCKFHFYFHTF